MNIKAIFHILGKVALTFAVLLCLPMILSLCFGDDCWWSFAIAIGISLVLGALLRFLVKPNTSVIFSREGFVIVSFSWLYVAIVGALPFVLSGAIPSFIDAFFETCSGFSTTGASILNFDLGQLDNMSLSLRFWRCFTHWIGGMGVIVFLMAVTSSSVDRRSIHLLRAEMPGQSVDKIVPKARNTAKILYLIYICLTVAQVLCLVIARMPLYDSVCTALSTAGTGGFSIRNDSLASYSSACQWITAVFMLLFGVNFNLYFLIIIGKVGSALRSRELWIYLGVVVASTAVITTSVLQQLPYTTTTADAIRHSVFQVLGYVTTTGSSTIPSSSSINNWPITSRCILILLMFLGGCVGSTAGGLKISRVVMLFKGAQKSIRRALHPNRSNDVRFEGKVLSDEALQGVTSYVALYVFIFALTFAILCFDPCQQLTLEANFATTSSCLNNVGPSLGVCASTMYMYSPVSKLVLAVVMLIGRLEIYPILIAFAPSTWLNK